MAGFQQRENAQIAKMLVLSEMQLASSLSELDVQNKSCQDKAILTSNSGWDKDKEENRAAKLHNNGLSEILDGE